MLCVKCVNRSDLNPFLTPLATFLKAAVLILTQAFPS